MSASSPDRNLLFGILALQMEFITRDALVAAMHAWVLEKSRALGEILVSRDDLSPEHRALLEPLVDAHVRRHGGDPRQSLAALSSVTPVRESLASIPDTELRESLVVLQVGDFSAVLSADAGSLTVAPAATAASAPLGRFRVLRPHARGGLGEVFVARDEELGRTVALKQIQTRHLDRPELRARFVVEAEISGNLEHPGIVPVYGLGAHADGRPFYAMRFIHGDSLREAIAAYHREAPGLSPDERTLRLRHLLGRFLDICDAIAYAHSRGVLHRDLKPDNVMLGKYGETLVVDWGLAKPLGRPEIPSDGPADGPLVPRSGQDSDQTEAGSPMGTPGYMSPEQALGELDRLGPATDVYSLGATLYCLLAGKPPLTGDDLVGKAVRGEIPAPGSAGKDVPKALEAVALKALARLPGDRYESVRELARDVERWLADEPVSARAETRAERAARWARRNRSWALAAAATLVAISCVATAAALLIANALSHERAALVEATRAKEDASRRLIQARESIDTLLTGVSEGLAAVPGASRVRRQLLGKAAGEYRRLAAEQGADPGVRFEAGSAFLRLGKIQEMLGELPAAEKSLKEGEAVLAELAKRERTPEVRDQLATGVKILGDVLVGLGRRDEAEAAYRRSIDVSYHLLLERADLVPPRYALGSARASLARLLAGTDRAAETDEMFRDGIEDLQAAASLPREEPRKDLSGAHNGYAQFLEQAGSTADADAHFRAAIAVSETLLRDSPNDPDNRSLLASSQRNLARFLTRLGRYEEAEKLFFANVAERQKAVSEDPDVPQNMVFLANARSSLGMFYRELGRLADSEPMHKQAGEMLARLVALRPDVPQYRERLALSRGDHAEILMFLGRLGEAEAEATAALDGLRKLSEENPTQLSLQRDLGNTLNTLARIQRRLGKYDATASSYRAGTEIFERLAKAAPGTPEYRDLLALLLNNHAELELRRGRPEDGFPLSRRAISIYEGLTKEYPEVVDYAESLVMSQTTLSQSLAVLGRNEEAQGLASQAASNGRKLVQRYPRNPLVQRRLLHATSGLAQIEARLGHAEASLGAWRESEGILQTLLREHPESAEYREDLWANATARADAILLLGRADEAVSALAGMRDKPASQAPSVYNAACVLSRASAEPAAGGESERAAALAVELLRRAAGMGLTDPIQYRDDPDLAPLQSRDDFQQLILELMDRAMPADPFRP